MTLVATRNVSARMRGYLASVMLELAPGVYSAARISPAVRERIWGVLQTWFAHEVDASVVMVWREVSQPGGQSVRILGSPPIEFVDVDGLILSKRSPTPTADARKDERAMPSDPKT